MPQVADHREEHEKGRQSAVLIGGSELFEKFVVGCASGLVGIGLLNHFSPRFARLPTVPVKVALVVMAGIGAGTAKMNILHWQCWCLVQTMRLDDLDEDDAQTCIPLFILVSSGGLYSEQKVSDFARGVDRRDSVPKIQYTLKDLFHDYKFKAIGTLNSTFPIVPWLPQFTFNRFGYSIVFRSLSGALWAGSIAASLSVGRAGLPFYQRLIDARIFAQWMTVFAAVSVGVAGVAFPDDREVSQFSVDDRDPLRRSFDAQLSRQHQHQQRVSQSAQSVKVAPVEVSQPSVAKAEMQAEPVVLVVAEAALVMMSPIDAAVEVVSEPHQQKPKL